MKVAVWGAGEVGWFLASRLCMSPVVTELVWINRTFARIDRRCLDFGHGLAFAPTCRLVTPRSQEDILDLTPSIDLLILTIGDKVTEGRTRADSYEANRAMFEETVRPFLSKNFGGIVLVVTNPLDLMVRVIQQWQILPPHRVFGLGTVVATARLKKALADYTSPELSPRDVQAYAIGTHDDQFVPMARQELAPGFILPEQAFPGILDQCRNEVVGAANRVKKDTHSTLFPIVEGIVQVVESIGLDRRDILTVSVLDPQGPDGWCYSLPSVVGREGVLHTAIPPSTGTPEGDALRIALDGLARTVAGK